MRLTFLSVLMLFGFGLIAQTESEKEENFKRHSLKLLIAHTYIPEGRPVGQGSNLLVAPTWGLDYDFYFTPKWSLGLHYDVEIMNYALEVEHDDTTLLRKNPMVFALVTQYEVWKKLSLGFGGGYELEKNESFWLARVSAEYAIEINEQFELAPNITYDYKENRTSAIGLGLAVGLKF